MRAQVEVDTVTGTFYHFHTSNGSTLPTEFAGGASCSQWTLGGELLVGLVSNVAGTTGSGIVLMGDQQRQWIYGNLYPGKTLVCHGIECRSMRNPIPNSLDETVYWRPCGGDVNVLAQSNFAWYASYDLQNNDSLFLGGAVLTGKKQSGSYVKSSDSGALQTTAELYTDASVQSNSLFATAYCPNITVKGTGADGMSSVKLEEWDAFSSCSVAHDSKKISKGCGLSAQGGRVKVTCTADNYPTKKVDSIIVNYAAKYYSYQGKPTETISCGKKASCTTEVAIPCIDNQRCGVRAQCVFVDY